MRSVFIGAPFSANRMYAVTKTGKLYKTQKYRQWIELNLPKVALLGPCEKFPVTIEILIIGGRDYKESNDPDNATKPIVDLLVRSGVIPDDNTKYVESAQSRFLYGHGKSECVTQIKVVDAE